MQNRSLACRVPTLLSVTARGMAEGMGGPGLWRHPTYTSRGAVTKTRPPTWHMGLKERAKEQYEKPPGSQFWLLQRPNFPVRVIQGWRGLPTRVSSPSLWVCRQRWDCSEGIQASDRGAEGIADSPGKVSNS